jgi:hypothetical protein
MGEGTRGKRRRSLNTVDLSDQIEPEQEINPDEVRASPKKKKRNRKARNSDISVRQGNHSLTVEAVEVAEKEHASAVPSDDAEKRVAGSEGLPTLPRDILAKVKARRNTQLPLRHNGTAPAYDEGRFAREANLFYASQSEAEQSATVPEESRNVPEGSQVQIVTEQEEFMQREFAADDLWRTMEKERKGGTVAGEIVGLSADPAEPHSREKVELPADFDNPTTPGDEEHAQPDLPDSQRQKKKKKRKSRVAEPEEIAEPVTPDEPLEISADVHELPQAQELAEPDTDVQMENSAPAKKARKRRNKPVTDENAQPDDHVQHEQAPQEKKKRARSRQSKVVETEAAEAETVAQVELAELEEIPETQEPGLFVTQDQQVPATQDPEVQQTQDDETPKDAQDPKQMDRAQGRKKRKRESKAADAEEPTEADPEIPETQDDDTPEDAEGANQVERTNGKKKRKRETKAADAEEPTEVDISPAKKSKKKRESAATRGTPFKSNNTTSANQSDRARTGAEKELAIQHTLREPYDLRDGGEFSADEAELIRRQIKQYQHRNDLALQDLVSLIQFTKPYGNSKRDKGTENVDTQLEARQIQCSTEFWREIYDVLPQRKNSKARGGTTGIQRFVRRRYHSHKGGGGWTEEEDAMLADLVAAHPAQWKKISMILGDRDEAAVRDRWRNYVQYGAARNEQFWSEQEEQRLIRAIKEVTESLKAARAAEGKPPLDEYTSRDINWQLVSEKVGTRSRLQCSMKWNTIKDQQAIRRHRKSMDGTERKRKRKSKPGFEKMRWGDKLDIILALSEGSYASEEDIDWSEVAANAEGTPWSAKDRKAVLSELREAIGEQEDFSSTLEAICLYLQEHYADELDEHYDPAADAEEDVDEEFSEGRKRRKRRSAPAKNKSSEFITASDDEA